VTDPDKNHLRIEFDGMTVEREMTDAEVQDLLDGKASVVLGAAWSRRRSEYRQAVDRAKTSKLKKIGTAYCAECSATVGTFTETREGVLFEAEIYSPDATLAGKEWSNGAKVPHGSEPIAVVVDWAGALEGSDQSHLDGWCSTHRTVRADHAEAVAQVERYRSKGKRMKVQAKYVARG